MKLPVIKAPILVNIIIAIISIYISGFGLLFGIAHMFGERNPNIPDSEHYMGVAMVALLCLLGVLFLILAIASIRGIIVKLKRH